MAATVADARAELYAMLEAAGLPMTPPSGGMVPPCVFIIPGSPWVEPSALKLHGRTVRFDIVGLVGTASDPSISEDSEAMAEAISTAITAGAWSSPTISQPTSYEVGGATYRAVRGTVEVYV